MTTICVSRELRMMAAESNEVWFRGGKPRMRSRSPSKLYRSRDYIVGMCGDSGLIARYMGHLRGRAAKPPKGEYEALFLYRDGRIVHVAGDGAARPIVEDYYAIGSGEEFAFAAMDALEIMGLPLDPRIAVRVACRRDPASAEPINSMRWLAQSEAK